MRSTLHPEALTTLIKTNTPEANDVRLRLRAEIRRRSPEALYQIISKRGHLPSADPLDTNSSPAQQHCRLGSPIGIFTLGCAS